MKLLLDESIDNAARRPGTAGSPEPDWPSGTPARARDFTDDVQFSAEDATRSDMDFLCQIVNTAITAGATTINLPRHSRLLRPQLPFATDINTARLFRTQPAALRADGERRGCAGLSGGDCACRPGADGR